MKANHHGKFNFVEEPLHSQLREFLEERENIIRLETASDIRAVAVKGIERELLLRFHDQIPQKGKNRSYKNGQAEKKANQIKRYVGFLVKTILEERGFVIDAQNVRLREGGFFSTGTRYKRKAPSGHS